MIFDKLRSNTCIELCCNTRRKFLKCSVRVQLVMVMSPIKVLTPGIACNIVIMACYQIEDRKRCQIACVNTLNSPGELQ